MEKKTLNEIKAAAREGKLYDFVANEYWRLEKEELKQIISELIWIASQNVTDEVAFEIEVANSIEENWCYCEE